MRVAGVCFFFLLTVSNRGMPVRLGFPRIHANPRTIGRIPRHPVRTIRLDLLQADRRAIRGGQPGRMLHRLRHALRLVHQAQENRGAAFVLTHHPGKQARINHWLRTSVPSAPRRRRGRVVHLARLRFVYYVSRVHYRRYHKEHAMDNQAGRFLRPDEVARYLGINRATISQWATSGHLPSYRFSPHVLRIKAEDLEACIAQSRTLPGGTIVPGGRFLRPDEVARYLGINRATISQWATSGHLPSYRFSPHVLRIKAEDLEACIAQSSRDDDPRRADGDEDTDTVPFPDEDATSPGGYHHACAMIDRKDSRRPTDGNGEKKTRPTGGRASRHRDKRFANVPGPL